MSKERHTHRPPKSPNVGGNRAPSQTMDKLSRGRRPSRSPQQPIDSRSDSTIQRQQSYPHCKPESQTTSETAMANQCPSQEPLQHDSPWPFLGGLPHERLASMGFRARRGNKMKREKQKAVTKTNHHNPLRRPTPRPTQRIEKANTRLPNHFQHQPGAVSSESKYGSGRG